jgi:hypothetical protein
MVTFRNENRVSISWKSSLSVYFLAGTYFKKDIPLYFGVIDTAAVLN